jgi:hypothetical protein
MPVLCITFSFRFGFPDVCLTATPVGPMPIPYPNISFAITDIPVAFRNIVCGGFAGTLADLGTISLGDIPGLAGVASGTVMGPAHALLGSLKVFLAAMPAMRWCCPYIQNSTNAPGIAAMPGQFKVWILV